MYMNGGLKVISENVIECISDNVLQNKTQDNTENYHSSLVQKIYNA